MALIACKECKKQVSSSAPTCPNCGIKDPGKSGISLPAAAAVIIIGIFVFSTMSSFAPDLQRPSAGETLPPSVSSTVTTQKPPATFVENFAKNKAAEIQTQTVPISHWKLSTQADPLTGKDLRRTSVRSGTKHDLHFPYGPNVGATLMVRAHPRYGRDIIVIVDSGQLLCPGYGDGCSINVRFDEKPAQRFTGRGPSDSSRTTVFLLPESKFRTALKSAKRVLIELPLYQDGDRIWDFDVTGFVDP